MLSCVKLLLVNDTKMSLVSRKQYTESKLGTHPHHIVLVRLHMSCLIQWLDIYNYGQTKFLATGCYNNFDLQSVSTLRGLPLVWPLLSGNTYFRFRFSSTAKTSQKISLCDISFTDPATLSNKNCHFNSMQLLCSLSCKCDKQ